MDVVRLHVSASYCGHLQEGVFFEDFVSLLLHTLYLYSGFDVLCNISFENKTSLKMDTKVAETM